MAINYGKVIDLKGDTGPNYLEKNEYDLTVSRGCWSVASLGAAKLNELMKKKKKKNPPAVPNENVGAE